MNYDTLETGVAIVADDSDTRLLALAEELAVPLLDEGAAFSGKWLLHRYRGALALSSVDKPHLQNIFVDLVSQSPRLAPARLAHELLLKAVGGLAPPELWVVDATAGLANDSALLLAAGHRVSMIERSPIIAALLSDALLRAGLPVGRASVCNADAGVELLRPHGARPDVIYLDPMFPVKNKSALTHKGLQALRELPAPPNDEGALLAAALEAARARVVVKRARKAPALPGRPPSFSYSGKLIRYDCYALRKLA